ncbi:hypothetical protein RirG_211090 [Rhizophagus irregularis DAOM 197198w]|uniref:Uncharacterized protein n=1 Tax=Rhizophagus irregularis (strain DAOM 197198w) TaxID=1432141 RepID=A0A015LQJ1_RHIIW|nr:hypothetical protein RirG_211090 [Rhizophagus irregularis DAOM 197198w]
MGKKSAQPYNDRTPENPPSYDEQSRKIENEEEPNSTVEELTFEPHIGTLLFPYRKVLEEMRSHHVEQESQRAQHLSHMLKWSVVDHSLFNDFEFVIRPAINMPLLESVLMETKINGFIMRL